MSSVRLVPNSLETHRFFHRASDGHPASPSSSIKREQSPPDPSESWELSCSVSWIEAAESQMQNQQSFSGFEKPHTDI